MTERKSFKRRVRARMEKTGERYTAARRHVVDRTPESAAQPEPDRISDDAVLHGAARRATSGSRSSTSGERATGPTARSRDT
jgi:hypothetical protein